MNYITSIAVRKKTVSIPATRVPKGGFITMVSKPAAVTEWKTALVPAPPPSSAPASAAPLLPKSARTRSMLLRSWAAMFSRARARAPGSMSYQHYKNNSKIISGNFNSNQVVMNTTPMTWQAPMCEAPMLSMPVPTPKSPTSWPSMSPNVSWAVNTIWLAAQPIIKSSL